jgi:phosphotransferase system HPr (HPr) family protein
VTSIDLAVRNPSGLHARPASLFAEAAGRFAARITVQNLDRGGPAVDAKSVLFVLTTGVQAGHRIRLTADGADEDAALQTIAALVDGGLGETLPDEAVPEGGAEFGPEPSAAD